MGGLPDLRGKVAVVTGGASGIGRGIAGQLAAQGMHVVIAAGGGLADVDVSQDENPMYRWISPEDAGAVVVRAIKSGDLYALTHPDWYPMVEQRHQAIAAAFRRAAGG